VTLRNAQYIAVECRRCFPSLIVFNASGGRRSARPSLELRTNWLSTNTGPVSSLNRYMMSVAVGKSASVERCNGNGTDENLVKRIRSRCCCCCCCWPMGITAACYRCTDRCVRLIFGQQRFLPPVQWQWACILCCYLRVHGCHQLWRSTYTARLLGPPQPELRFAAR